MHFQKAFDKEFLLYKLRQIGVPGNFYFAVKALYGDTKSCVKINNMVLLPNINLSSIDEIIL